MAMPEAKRTSLIGATLVLLVVTTAQANLGRALDQTVNEAAQAAAQTLNETSFEDVRNIAVLPLWGACDQETKNYITNAVQGHIIGGPYKVMERQTQAWEMLLSEIEWGSLREDIMNADTIQRFGRVEGCDAVLYGTVRECTSDPDSGRAVTRLSLKMGIVETGEARWSSGEVMSVRVVGQTVRPRATVDPAVTRALDHLMAEATAGLVGKDLDTANFGLFPLLGQDQDGYITEVLQAELAQAGCNPVPVSRAEWQEYLVAHARGSESVEAMRDFARERGYDAFLYGTVNECRVLERKYKAVARATLTMVNTETGEAVWSPGEIRGRAWLDWQDVLGLAVSDPIVWVLGGVVVLLVVWRTLVRLFRSATRPR